MENLSITVCGFRLRRYNSKGLKMIYELNQPLTIPLNDEKSIKIDNSFELFEKFFQRYCEIYDDIENQRAFSCSFNDVDIIDANDFIIYPVMIKSGVYGNASDIIDVKAKKFRYSKGVNDADVKQFYLAIVFPKDNNNCVVQKGMLIFQNIGQYGIKTFFVKKFNKFLIDNYMTTFECYNISPAKFVENILKNQKVMRIDLIKNYKSSDISDNYAKGYGQEARSFSKFNFNDPFYEKIKRKMKHFSGDKNAVFELDDIQYDNVKATVDIGDRSRIVSLHNLENISIIESIPDDIKNEFGNPDKNKLFDYLTGVIDNYLNDMILSYKDGD